MRPERHIPNSIATMRTRLINALAKNVPGRTTRGLHGKRLAPIRNRLKHQSFFEFEAGIATARASCQTAQPRQG